MNEQVLIVDANPMISALLGGKARVIFHSGSFRFFTTERKIWEVKRYVPFIAAKIGASEMEVFEAIELLPVATYQDAFYDDHKARARELIGGRDPTDVDLLALALKLHFPIWSHDRDFLSITGIVVITTEELLAQMAEA